MAIDIKFDPNQQYQRDAIDSVVELFAGQETAEQGIVVPDLDVTSFDGAVEGTTFQELVFGNSLALASETLRTNLRRVQDRQVVLEDGTTVPAVAEPLRRALESGEMPLEFSVEMETGTGKTYVYLRTIAELNRKYGFNKFVIVVPSVAIREGVLSSLKLLREHIRDIYDGLQYDHYEPPRHVRRLRSLGRMESCQGVRRRGTRSSCVSGRPGWSLRSGPTTSRTGRR